MFSIIIPVFNAENYIKRCVDCIINQSFEKWELLLVDDGSTDESGKICDEYHYKDERIKVFHQKNAGASAARNIGIKNATHDYIIFLDSDDYWINGDFLVSVKQRLDLLDSDVLSFNFYKKNNNNKSVLNYYFSRQDMPLYKNINERIEYIANNQLWISAAWNKVIKRSLFKKNNLFFNEGVTSEDIEWSARLAIFAQTFDYLNIAGVVYVQREDSVSHSMTYKKLLDLTKNVLSVESIFLCANNSKKYLLNGYLSYQICILIINAACIDDGHRVNELKSKLLHLKRYLKICRNKKILFIKLLWCLFGYDKMMLLLKKIKNRCN